MKRIYALLNAAKISVRVSLVTCITLMCSLWFINTAQATHSAGADISYRWISGNTYEVTVAFYRDCSGVAAPTTISVSTRSASLGVSFATVLPRVSGTGQEITFPCGGTTNCNGGSINGLQRYVYRGNVTLPNVAVDWIFSYQICCRNCNITTITHPSPCNASNTEPQLYVEARLNSVVAPTNSSPSFSLFPVAFICQGQPFTFNQGAVETNGDSIAYELITPKTSSTGTVTFVGGFSSTNFITSSPAATLSATTGQLNITPTVLNEVGILAVLVKEYRNGILIGSTIRDMQFKVISCTNSNPSATGINGGSGYNLTVCPGQLINFSINTSDPDGGQTLTLEWNNGISNPAATFIVSGGQPPVGTFNWQTTLADASSVPYTFVVTVRDNGCNYNQSQSYLFTINVTSLDLSVTKSNFNGFNVGCNGGNNGSATVTPGGGQSPFTYAWSTGATTATASNLAAGNYTVTVTDANACSGTASALMIQPSAINLNANVDANASCFGDPTGAISTTVSGGITGYTYLWSNGATTTGISNLAGGSYTVTVTDGNGCTVSQSANISELGELIIDITSQQPAGCNGETTGAINLTVSGGTAPYSFTWSNGATTEDLTNLSAGTYNVTVLDANLCQSTQSVIITQPSAIVPLISSTTINGVNVACFGSNSGSASVSVSGGTPPYNYLWSTGETTSSVTGLFAGLLSVTVSDNNGCSGFDSFTLTQPAVPFVATIDSTDLITCSGSSDGSIYITVSGNQGAYTFVWSNGATTEDITNLGPGTYTITVNDATGCSSTSSATLIAPTPVNVLAQATDTVGFSIPCNGEASGGVVTFVTGGTLPYSYLWNTGETSTSIAGLTAGIYQVTVSDANGCTGKGIVTLTQPDTILPIITSATVNGGGNLLCFGDGNAFASVSITGGTAPYIYTWSNGETTASVNNLPAGQIIILVNDANGCSATDTFDVIQPDSISASSISTVYPNGFNVTCFGATDGDINLTASGGTSPYTYSWSNGAITEDISGIAAGTYTVVITDGNACTNSFSFTVTTPPTINITSVLSDYNGVQISCNGNTDGSIDISAAGGSGTFTYGWSNGSSDEDLTNLTAGTYTVTIVDNTGCTSSTSITLNEPAILTTTLTPVNVSCFGLFDGAVNNEINGGTTPYSVTWSNGSTDQNLSSLAAGSFSVTIDDVNGCSITAGPVDVTQPDSISLSASVTDIALCNGDTSGAIDLTVSGGSSPYTYQWTNESTNQDVINLPGGTYSVTVVDNNSCAKIQEFTINQPDTISSSISISQNLCDSIADINATISGGTSPYTYAWSNGATTEDLTGVSEGTYTLVITDNNGCADTINTTITNLSVVISSTLTQPNCSVDPNGSINLTINGGVLPYTFTWSNGATTEDITATGGTYNVTVSDAGGCSSTASFTIDSCCNISLSANLVSPGCGPLTGSIDLVVTGAVGTVTYAWSNGATTEDLTSLLTATYSVTVTDGNGCTATDSFDIIAGPSAVVLTGVVTNPLCAEDLGSINTTTTGGTAPYTYSWGFGSTDEDLIDLSIGTYSVTVTDANNCTAENSFNVTAINQVTIIQNITQPTCADNDGAVDLTITATASPYTILWSTGATTEDVDGLSAGTYTYTVTDAGLCTYEGSVTLTLPVVTANGVVTDGSCGTLGSIDLSATGGTSPYTYLWSNVETTEDISGLVADVYTVTVTDANGCSATNAFNVSQSSGNLVVTGLVTDPQCAEDLGSINITVTGGLAPYTYNWTFGFTDEDLIDLASGIYSVTVTDQNGCTGTNSFTVAPANSIIIAVDTLNPTCGNSDGSISLNVTGTAAPFTYLWSNGSTDASITNLPAGVYGYTVTDAGSCTIPGSVTLTEPTITIDGNVTNATCSTTGSIDVTSSGGASPYNYIWSNSATTEDLTGLIANAYDVTVTDANSCSGTASFDVTVDSTIDASITLDGNLCQIPLDVNLTANSTSTSTPFTYLWSGAETTSTINVNADGSYDVTVTDNSGCSGTASITVTATSDLSLSFFADTIACGDIEYGIDLTVSGGSGTYSYAWSNGGTNEDIVYPTLNPNQFYTVTVTDGTGCSAVGGSTVVSIGGNLDVTITPSDFGGGINVTCVDNNGSLTAVVNSGVAPFTYAWSTGSTADNIIGLSSNTSYSVTITDAGGCSFDTTVSLIGSDTLLIVLNSPTFNGENNISCAGANDGSIQSTVNAGVGPFVYTWSNGATTADLTDLGPGTYSVSVTDVDGCSGQASIVLTEPLPLTLTIEDSLTDCGSGSGIVTVSLSGIAEGGTPAYAYTWSTGNNNANIDVTTSGTYDLTVTDLNGCSNTASITLVVPELLDVTSIITDSIFCGSGDIGAIDVTVTGGFPAYTFVWSNGETTEDLSGLGEGTYTLTVTDANQCSVTTTQTLVIPPLAITTEIIANNLCNGDSTAIITASTTDGGAPYIYNWSNGASADTLTGLPAGTYDLTITDVNGCTGSTSITVVDPPQLTITFSTSFNNCGSGNLGVGEIDITAAGGTGNYTYLWNIGSTDADLIDLAPGTYTLTVTDENGCVAVDSIDLVQPDPVSISDTTIVQPSCGLGGSISITVIGGQPAYSYSWSNGATTSTVSNLLAGTYNVTILDTDSCSVTASFELTSTPPVTVTIDLVDTLGCGEDTGGLQAIGSGGLQPYQYLWSAGASTDTIFGLVAGVYNVTLTDAAGCTATASFNLQTQSDLAVNIAIIDSPSTCSSADGSIYADITGGVQPYTILWSDSSATDTLTGLTQGIYSVTVTDAAGCSVSASLFLGTNVTIDVTITETGAILCNGDSTASISSSIAGGTSPYTFIWSNASTDQDLTNVGAGTYTVTVTDAGGCSGISNSVTINQPAVLNANLSVYYDEACAGESLGNIAANPTGGVPTYSWLWNISGFDNDTLTGLTPASGLFYTVTVTDDNGCTIVDSIDVPVNTPLTNLTSSSVDALCFGDEGSIIVSYQDGTDPYTIEWSTGSNSTNSLSSTINAVAGIYDITVTDANGCSLTITDTINEPTQIIITATIIDTTTCPNSTDGSYSYTITGGTAPYSIDATDTIINVGTGTFTVTVTDANGCSANATGIMPSLFNLNASISITAEVLCISNPNGELSALGADGSGTYGYLWDNGSTDADISGLAPGTYCVTVTDLITGCEDTTCITLTSDFALAVNVTSTNVICNSACDGTANAIASGGVAPYTYAWSNASTDSSLTNLCPDTYTVTITDGSGCTIDGQVIIIEPAALSITITSSDDTIGCNSSASSTLTASTTGGQSPYSYLWSNAGTDDNITVNTGGVYTVTVTDDNGCTSTIDYTIIEIPQANLSFAVTDVLGCNGNATGSIDMTITGGVSPFSILWNTATADTTEDIDSLVAGVYNVTVIDANGCTVNGFAAVTQPAPINASFTVVSPLTCNGLCDAVVIATPNAGLAPFAFVWSNGDSTDTADSLCAGTYFVTMTDANGCAGVDSTVVSAPAAFNLNFNISNPISCNGQCDGEVTLTVIGGVAPYTYAWSTSTNDTTNIVDSLCAGTYFVTVQDDNGCQALDSFLIVAPSAITLGTVSSDITCGGTSTGSVDLTITGGTAPYSQIWSNGTTTEDLSSIPAGNYCVTVSDNNGCSATICDTIIDINPALVLSATISDSIQCNGSCTADINLTITGGVGPFTTAWTGGASSEDLTDQCAGTYNVLVTDANGCTASLQVIVTEPSVLQATASVTTPISCALNDGCITITPSGGTAPYSVVWSNTSNANPLCGLSAGSYSATVTDANGCTIVVSNIVLSNPTPINVATTATNTCVGSCLGTASATGSLGTAPYTYSWSGPGGFTANTQSIANLCAGNYNVTVTDANNCTATASISITDLISPTANAGNDDSACGTNTSTLNATQPGVGETGTWTVIGGSGASIIDVNDPNSGVTGLDNGANTFVFTVTNGVCSDADTVVIAYSDISADAGIDTAVCGTDLPIILNATGNGIWSVASGTATFSNNTSPTSSVSGLTTGDNFLLWTVSDAICTVSDTINVRLKTNVECADSILIPTGFSPNGDGSNDGFVILGLSKYPNNELRIFNRWGNVVYLKTNYNNEWRGENTNGDALPDGTYFVIFTSPDNGGVDYSGYVDLRRK